MFSISGKLQNSNISDFWKLWTLMFSVISQFIHIFHISLVTPQFPPVSGIVLTYVLRSPSLYPV